MNHKKKLFRILTLVRKRKENGFGYLIFLKEFSQNGLNRLLHTKNDQLYFEAFEILKSQNEEHFLIRTIQECIELGLHNFVFCPKPKSTIPSNLDQWLQPEHPEIEQFLSDRENN